MNFSAVADYVRKMQRSAEQGELYGFADECRRLLVMLEAPQIQPPIKMMLFCPRCRTQHIDMPDLTKKWTNPPHATHTCDVCGLLWRPANENTTGVSMIHVEEPQHRDRIFNCIPRKTVIAKHAYGHNMTLLQIFGVGPRWTVVCGHCGVAFVARLPLVDAPGVTCPRCDVVNTIPVEIE